MPRLFLSVLFLLFLVSPVQASEIEVMVKGGIGQASYSGISGLHTNKAGTAITGSTVSLGDNKANSSLIGLDVNYYLSDSIAINTGISYTHQKLKDTTAVVNAGGQIGPFSFPSFSYTGYMFEIGPLYRWKNILDSTSAYLAVDFDKFWGKQNNTRYSVDSNLYGRGGPKTKVQGTGFSTKIGVSYKLGSQTNLLVEYRFTHLSINANAMRSLQWGYKAKGNIHNIVLGVGFVM